jgi:hypothetical protein
MKPNRMTSPKTSICNCSEAALPIRTGFERIAHSGSGTKAYGMRTAAQKKEPPGQAGPFQRDRRI